ncbi:hypothetical protein CK203_112644 [Vitis vinifera]|uniref:Reverse transcriptase Ty1/copia-type domain-containing protein n=1 Tax=Vitis vinifera TaxID=29760 RepID=A0A438DBV2_VITVI|nr:hypothetical protein CK203_112644 [Vitis vinifera]
MHSEFEMSMMGELNFFLGLQIKQLKEGTFINQEKYIRDLPKRFNMEEAKTMKTPMSSSIKLDKDEKGSVDRFVEAVDLNTPLALHFLIVSSGFSKFCVDSAAQKCFLMPLQQFEGQLQHLSHAPRVSGVCASLSTSFFFTISLLLMAPKRETVASRAQGKRPAEPGLSEVQAEVRSEESGSREKYQLLTTTTFRIISTVRGVEIQLDPESICHILDIALVGLMAMGKLSAHSLTVISQVLHHMIWSILLPQGGHQDEVSYLEAFLVNSILTGRWIHVGYLMMMRMISYYESTTHVLPYGLFLTRVFKDVKFEKAPDGSWIKRAEQPPTQAQEQGKPKLDIPPLQSEGVHFEALFPEPMMSELTYTVGPSSQPSFTKLPYTEPSPHQAPHAPDHAPWMDLSTRISSLGTRMEELTVFSDTRF